MAASDAPDPGSREPADPLAGYDLHGRSSDGLGAYRSSPTGHATSPLSRAVVTFYRLHRVAAEPRSSSIVGSPS